VVAQSLDAEVPTRHPRPAPRIALCRVAPRAAPRRAFDHRGRRPAAGRAREAPGYRGDAERRFRTHADAIPRGAGNHAGARTATEAEGQAGFPAPQARLNARREPHLKSLANHWRKTLILLMEATTRIELV